MTDVIRRVGARLRQLRHDRKLTQEQLAEAAGLSYKFIGEIERGIGNPTLTTLAALANALSVSIADVVAEPARPPRISAHDAVMVREALGSIEEFVQRALADGPKSSRYRLKRRR